MTLVVDASVVASALLDTGPVGSWAEGQLSAGSLAAPHLMPAEAANVLRRATLAGDVAATAASVAHQDLTSLRVDLYPYAACASRIWELRGDVTVYDACYVALAELLDAPLATLDLRLSRAAGPRCTFLLPPT